MMRQILVAVPVLMFLGCAHKQQQEAAHAPTAVQQPAAPEANSTAAQSGAGEKTCRNDLECGSKQLCIRSRCVDITPEMAECQTIRVHFDFEVAELKQDDQASLQRIARCLKADQALHVSVQGNADERGTQEYNLSLGDRRATAVATYLERLGVSATQLKTVSYGKENPLCVEHDEACWAQNRRAAVKTEEEARKTAPKRGKAAK